VLSLALASACCPVHGYHRTALAPVRPPADEVLAACTAAGLQGTTMVDEERELWIYASSENGMAMVLWFDGEMLVGTDWGHHPSAAELEAADLVLADIVQAFQAAGLPWHFGSAVVQPNERCEACR
jgi:hypothetical protein